MEVITLKSQISRLERLSYLLFAVIFTYALFHAAVRMRIVELVALLLLGGFIAFIWYSGRSRSQIRIDGAGLLLEAFHAASLGISWSDIEAFGITNLSTLSNGVYRPTGKQYVGIRLVNSCVLKETKQCSENRREAGYDVLVSASYGMPLKEFEAFLIDAQKRATTASGVEIAAP